MSHKTDESQREGLETARFPTGVGSNPTPRTRDEPYSLRIFEVLWQMKEDGCSEKTIEPIGRRLRNSLKQVNVDTPDAVKGFATKAGWANSCKGNLINV